MALPWLDSIPVWGFEPSSQGSSDLFPKRFGVLFMAFVYGRYEEYVSAGFWALGSSLTLALVLNVVGLFRS